MTVAQQSAAWDAMTGPARLRVMSAFNVAAVGVMAMRAAIAAITLDIVSGHARIPRFMNRHSQDAEGKADKDGRSLRLGCLERDNDPKWDYDQNYLGKDSDDALNDPEYML